MHIKKEFYGYDRIREVQEFVSNSLEGIKVDSKQRVRMELALEDGITALSNMSSLMSLLGPVYLTDIVCLLMFAMFMVMLNSTGDAVVTMTVAKREGLIEQGESGCNEN